MTDSPNPQYGVALMSCPQRKSQKITDELWGFPGCQGLEELPEADANFYVPSADFEILEFGSEAAEKCAEWLDSGAFQRTHFQLFLKVYFAFDPALPFPEDFREYLAAHDKRLPWGCELLAWNPLPDTDYLENYKKSVKGVAIGDNLWVGPPWDQAPEGRIAFIVEPGMAFGTGDHPTTQMCLEMLEVLARKSDFKPRLIYDVGTGSGILAVAARYFFPDAEIVMTDLDPLCEVEVKKTFALNKLPLEPCRLVCGPRADLRRSPADWKPGDLLLSNIYAEVLASLISELGALLKPGAPWVVSGLLEGPATEDFETKSTASLFTLLERRRLTRERPVLQAGKNPGLSRESESWGARLFEKR
jgi:ribosomal protein L11 methyltransferase